jgi:transposase
MNPQREQFGEERFLTAIRNNAHLTVGEFVENVRKEIQDFTQGFPQNDDITLVAIQEKLSADSHIQELRTKLIKMVEEEGMSVKDACRRMRVSSSTYYRYKKRWDEEGEEGLKNRKERDRIAERHISIEDRQKIFDVIKKHPEFGAKRIVQDLNTEHYEFFEISETRLYEELKRLNLNTEELRRKYIDKGSTQAGRLRPPGTPVLTVDGQVIGLDEFDAEPDEDSDGNGKQKETKKLPPSQSWSTDGPDDVIATNIPRTSSDHATPDHPGKTHPKSRDSIRRIPPKSPMWPSPEQMEPRETEAQDEEGASTPPTSSTQLPSHMIHPAVRLIPLIIHEQGDLAGFVSKEVERTMNLDKKILVLDCSGVDPGQRILWSDLIKNAKDFRENGGEIFLWNLQSLHLNDYQKYGVKRNVVHLTSTRDLEERLRFLRL